MERIKDNLNKEGEKKSGYFPKVVRQKTINLKELAVKASKGTTINSFEIEAAMQMVIEIIKRELLDSNHVCLNGFGTFSLSAESRIVENPNELRAESISIKRVVFVSSRTLMKDIRKAKFVRLKKSDNLDL